MFNRIKMRSLTVKEATGWVIFFKNTHQAQKGLSKMFYSADWDEFQTGWLAPPLTVWPGLFGEHNGLWRLLKLKICISNTRVNVIKDNLRKFGTKYNLTCNAEGWLCHKVYIDHSTIYFHVLIMTLISTAPFSACMLWYSNL